MNNPIENSVCPSKTRQRTIGGTTYMVVSEFSPDARETAVEKMRRIILEDSEKVS